MNRQSVQADGLIHWSPFDAQDPRAEYISSRQAWGTFEPGLGRGPGIAPPLGEPALFLATGIWDLPAPAPAQLVTPLTVSLWYTPYFLAGAGGVLWWVGSPSTWSSFYVSLTTTSIALIHVEATVFNAVADWPTSPVANRSYHIVGVYESIAKRTLYVDGIERAVNTYDNTPHGIGTKTLVRLNADYTAGNGASGYYRDFRIYSRALKREDVWQLYSEDTKYELYGRRRVSVGAVPKDVPDSLPNLGSWYRADEGVWSRSSAHTDGSTSYLSAPHSSTLSLVNANGFTVGGWVWFDATASSAKLIVAKRESVNVEWQLYIDSTGLTYTFYNGSGYPGNTVAMPSTGAWHFVVLRWNTAGGGTGQLFVDNVGSVPIIMGSPSNGAGNLGFGVDISAVGTYNWPGRLQNWFTYARYLSSDELSFLWNGGAGRHYGELSAAFKTDMRTWWPMDEKSGTRRDVHGGVHLTDNAGVTETDGHVLNPIADGLRVYRWDDLGPKALHVTQEIPTYRPTYLAVAVNGLPAIDFERDSLQRLTRLAVPFSDIAGAQSGNAWIFYYPEGPETFKIVWVWNPALSFTETYELLDWTGALYYDHGLNSSSAGRISGAKPVGFEDQWRLVETYRDGTTLAELRVDDTVIASGTMTASLTGVAPWHIGAGLVGGENPLDGKIAELAFYLQPLSAGNRTAFRNYINARYYSEPPVTSNVHQQHHIIGAT